MKRHLQFFFILYVLWTTTSCSHRRSCDDILKIVHQQNNGFKKEWQLQNGSIISCSFLPVSYQLCQQKTSTHQDELVTKDELQKEITFLLEVPFSEYSKSERYFMFNGDENIKLEQSNKRILPLYVFLEQSYGLNGFQKVFIGFDNNDIDTNTPLDIVLENYLFEPINLRFDFLLQELKL